MDEQRLVDALTARADEDARKFREQYPDETPSDRWIENSYTAALPLAKDSTGIDPGAGPHPHLFDAYKREIASLVGVRSDARDGVKDTQLQEPTAGEN
jgi:hypothetical protein